MATRRERIEAYFRARNASRFKQEVKSVARGLKEIGEEGTHASDLDS